VQVPSILPSSLQSPRGKVAAGHRKAASRAQQRVSSLIFAPPPADMGGGVVAEEALVKGDRPERSEGSLV
jgi:hypothetical protein